jgi:hypothetical protein
VSPAFIAIAVTLVVVALGGAILALTDGGPVGAARRRPFPVPAPWIALGAIVLLLGVVIMPRILGFTFLFLPMIWSRRARRPRRGPGTGGPGPRANRDPSDEDR